MSTFEECICELTQPLNGQYPRPWMTKLANPQSARVFIVGMNQAKGYPVERVGAHQRHLDALFNRNGETCRGLYDYITGGQPSPTRLHIDDLTCRLERLGVNRILETNVICYSTPVSIDLGLPIHRGGREQGREIFRFLLARVSPPVMIVHGAGAARELAKVLGTALPAPPDHDREICSTQVGEARVFVIPSLAPPGYNKWSGWAPDYQDRVATAVAEHLEKL